METKMNTPMLITERDKDEAVKWLTNHAAFRHNFISEKLPIEVTPEWKAAAIIAGLWKGRAALREALEAVLSAGRGTSGRIILDADQEASARAALEATK